MPLRTDPRHDADRAFAPGGEGVRIRFARRPMLARRDPRRRHRERRLRHHARRRARGAPAHAPGPLPQGGARSAATRTSSGWSRASWGRSRRRARSRPAARLARHRSSSSASGAPCAKSRPARPRPIARSPSASARPRRCAPWRMPAPQPGRGRDPLSSRGAHRRLALGLSLGDRAKRTLIAREAGPKR